MFRTLPVIVAVVMVAATGLAHGVWTARWSDEDAPREAAARLASIPLVAGEWNGTDLEMDPKVFKQTEASGALQRRYVNRRNGNVVTISLLCGRSGPISVHTPEICFPGAGFTEIGDAIRYSIPGDPDSKLWIRRFQKQAAVPVPVRVLYGWSTDGTWQAPDSPRRAFAGSPVLYKLYLVRELPKSTESMEGDPAVDLLRVLQPQLRAALTADSLRRS
jgi:Protein of unknown function (DUF3485)